MKQFWLKTNIVLTCAIRNSGRTKVRSTGKLPSVVILGVWSVVAMGRGRPLHDGIGGARGWVVHPSTRSRSRVFCLVARVPVVLQPLRTSNITFHILSIRTRRYKCVIVKFYYIILLFYFIILYYSKFYNILSQFKLTFKYWLYNIIQVKLIKNKIWSCEISYYLIYYS